MTDIYVQADNQAVEIDNRSNGKVPPVMTRTAEYIKEEIELVRCPVHGQTADSISFQYTQEGRLDYSVEGCCNELNRQIEKLSR